MNKRDLVECVAAELGGSRTAAEKAVKAVLDSILDGVDRDGNVAIAGFGTFERKERAARTGRNPRTGETLESPSFDEQYEVVVEHYRDMLELYGEDVGVKIARKHLGWYTKGMHGSAEFRNRVNFIDQAPVVLDELERFYEPFLKRRAA